MIRDLNERSNSRGLQPRPPAVTFFSRNPDTRLQGMIRARFRTVPQRPKVKVLRKGFRGAEVQRLQKLLNLRTYPCPSLAVDGIFGPKTYDAVRRYQRAASLPNDGVVGANTWFSLLEGKQVRLPPTVPLTRADFPTTNSQATSLTAAPSATPAGKPEPPVSQSSPKQTPPKASVPSAKHKQITIWEWPLEKKLTVALSRVPERLPGKARDEFTALLQFENLALSLVIIAGFCLLSGGTALVVGALIFGFDIALSLASALQTASLAATEDELNEAADELAHVVLAVGVAAFIKGVGKIAKGGKNRASGGETKSAPDKNYTPKAGHSESRPVAKPASESVNHNPDYPGHGKPIQETQKPKYVPSSQEAAGKKLASQDVAKGHNSPDGVWDQNVLQKNKALKKRLDDFAAGEKSSGQSVKKLEVSGKSAEQLHQELTQKGFKWHREKLGGVVDGDTLYNTPHDVYKHPDGGMVRVKPEGRPGDVYRPEPHVSKSVLENPNGGTEWKNEAFKVTNDGHAVPKSTKSDDGMRQQGLKGEMMKGYQDGVMEAAHTNLPIGGAK
jgi:peptidoglycan hydrolase-like protein with peptidoglycan-binding domain